MTSPANPPLGELSGMTWDPLRRRYFPTPKEPQPIPGPSRPTVAQVHRDRAVRQGQGRERRGGGAGEVEPMGILPSGGGGGCSKDRSSAARAVRIEQSGRGYRRRGIYGDVRQNRGNLVKEQYLAGLAYEGLNRCCQCSHERINSLQTFTGGTYLAATDRGKVLMRTRDGDTHVLAVCSDTIVGLHYDPARMTSMVIGGGEQPHLHVFRHDPDTPEHISAWTSDIDGLVDNEISCVASYDDTCVLGTSRSFVTIQNYEAPRMTPRKLSSDPLALEFGKDPNIVYAGLRNSNVVLADLRTPMTMPYAVCRSKGGKAVVGVKRLDDAAVPYGLVVSAMGNELLIYDIRFNKSGPLHTLPHHINSYFMNLGLTTTPDSKYIFASGSDRRIGLWSSLTGERIHPTPNKDEDEGKKAKDLANPLARVFPSMIQKLAVREDDWGLEVACAGEVMHFGYPGMRGEGGEEEQMGWGD